MIFGVNKKTGEMEIVFNETEIDRIKKEKRLVFQKYAAKAVIDNFGAILANLAETIIEHTGNFQSFSGREINNKDDKSNK